MQDRLGDFQRRRATLWAISVDPVPTSQDLREGLALEFPLGADPDLRVIRAYGVEMAGKEIALPATFVLAQGTGRIVYKHVGETVFDRPHVDQILAAVDQAAQGPGRLR